MAHEEDVELLDKEADPEGEKLRKQDGSFPKRNGSYAVCIT